MSLPPKTKERLQGYQDLADLRLMPRLPILFYINGRNFDKATSLCQKPFDSFLETIFTLIMDKLVHEIDGAFFAYHCCDEILIVSRNDQSPTSLPWLGNKVQKLVSTVSSIASAIAQKELGRTECAFLGDPVFLTSVCTVPSMSEALNAVITKQQSYLADAVNFACFFELLKFYDKAHIRELIGGLTFDEKIALLKEETGVEYREYASAFKRGVGMWKVPEIHEEGMRNVWKLQEELPVMNQNQEMMKSLFMK